MEKLGQLDKDARRTGALGPDRRRHPALAQRAGLPRRPRAALQLPRRPVHEAAAGAGARSGPADDGRLRDGDQRDHQDHRRPGAPGHEGVRGRVRHALRRVPAAGASAPSSCSRTGVRRSWWSPRRSRTRCARRRTSSSGCAQERMPLAGLVVNRASSKPDGDLSAHAAMTGVERLRTLRRGPRPGGRTAPAARRPAARRRAREAADRPVRDQPSRRTHGGAAGAVDRRARPRRPAPHRRAAGAPRWTTDQRR